MVSGTAAMLQGSDQMLLVHTHSHEPYRWRFTFSSAHFCVRISLKNYSTDCHAVEFHACDCGLGRSDGRMGPQSTVQSSAHRTNGFITNGKSFTCRSRLTTSAPERADGLNAKREQATNATHSPKGTEHTSAGSLRSHFAAHSSPMELNVMIRALALSSCIAFEFIRPRKRYRTQKPTELSFAGCYACVASTPIGNTSQQCEIPCCVLCLAFVATEFRVALKNVGGIVQERKKWRFHG